METSSLKRLLAHRIHLAHLPTPIQFMPRISDFLGIRLYVKRDDLTESIASGNKIRKLEYLMADAQKSGADTVVSYGGVQSNHCRAVAWAAAKLGLSCVLALRGEAPDQLEGNLLLDHILGADVRFYPKVMFQNPDHLDSIIVNELREKGKIPYSIPVGGSNATGTLGYVQMMRELMDSDIRFDHMYHALFNDLSLIHENDMTGNLPRKSHFVCHHHHGHAFMGQIPHDIQYFIDHFRIQCGCRLIKEHDFGAHGQSPCDGDTLLLAAGQLGGVSPRLVMNANFFKKGHGKINCVASAHFPDLHRGQCHIFQGRHMGIQIELLKHKPNFGSKPGDVGFPIVNRDVVHNDLTGRNRFQTIDTSNQGAFPGPAGAADDRDLSGIDIQTDIFKDMKLAKPFVDLVKLNHLGISRDNCGIQSERTVTISRRILGCHDCQGLSISLEEPFSLVCSIKNP